MKKRKLLILKRSKPRAGYAQNFQGWIAALKCTRVRPASPARGRMCRWNIASPHGPCADMPQCKANRPGMRRPITAEREENTRGDFIPGNARDRMIRFTRWLTQGFAAQHC